MKALTLTQPWATLVANHWKSIETRSWATSYRGPIAIHAAKRFPADCKDLCYEEPFKTALGMPEGTELLWRPPEPVWVKEAKAIVDELPLGMVIATARLVDCVTTEEVSLGRSITVQEELFGNYEPRRFAWLLEDVQGLLRFVPAKGMLFGLWEWRQ